MNDLLEARGDQDLPGEIGQTEPTRLLSDSARDWFLALLESDARPNQALKAAAAEYKKGHREGDTYYFTLERPEEQPG